MLSALKHRLRPWFIRHSVESGPVLLTQRRIFILPTKQGLSFAVVLLLMLVGDINYNLSLGYVLTFLLAMMALMSAFHAFRNLAHLQIRASHVPATFCGEKAYFPLHFHSPLARYHLCLRDSRGKVLGFDLLNKSEHEILFPVSTTQRGWLELGRLTLYTEFPLGLFRAWSYLHFDSRCLVYANPIDDLALPTVASPDGSGKQQMAGDDDFAGLRKFVIGDMLSRVDWKVFAREKGLLVKQFSTPLGNSLWLDIQDTPDVDLEKKLSRLTRWVINADVLGLSYGLRLGSLEIPTNNGTAHRDECLRQIALYQLPS